ncbi:putative long-chain-fatty-acid--CoA ligase [Rosa chinensis]|uniref:Putative long-chain-fatty-acid--CoA ligase n=1 Tax=Rosa chinensis TaxID=74649 RepID=A0A2P6PNE3_ROSCH|nr:putative long-chain-fatty-acid--CoA ligase [Rosa chinensis]
MCGLHIKRCIMQPFVWVQPSEAMVSILPQWIIAMEGCESHAITYVPLYDTLGANAVEFIINRAEVSIAFVQENKIPAIISILPNCSTHLKTIVSFTNVSSTQKKEAEELGVSCFLWEEFLHVRKKNHIFRLLLAHIYDQIIESYCIYKGSSIGFWRGDVRFLLDKLQELKPTMFCGVP